MPTIYRGRVFTPVADPFRDPDADHYRYFEDGHLAVGDDGTIASIGDFDARPEGNVVDLGRTSLLSPGFVDTHLHAPQLEMIGSYGGHLLEWLNRYTFPTEAKFADVEHAKRVAVAVYDELLANGTTTGLIFSTIHHDATDALFAEAERRGFRAIIGKTMMDRHAPDALVEETERSAEESRALLEKWHGRGLLGYAITPRFAPTSTPRLLELAGEIRRDHPDAWVQTHVSENIPEVKWVAELFPDAEDYVDVYDRYGLLGSKTILAHGVHLSDRELDVLHDRDSRIAHCPNSNLFLGSGLFPLQRVQEANVGIGLGSDIGAGTRASILMAMADAYKVQQVRGVSLNPFELWYLGTLGGARALSLDDSVGSLEEGKDADFVVLDLEATRLLTYRTRQAESISDVLAGCIFLGDDRLVATATIRGREVYRRGS